MELADRIRVELPFGWFVTLGLRQAADVAAADDRVRWDSGLEGIGRPARRSSFNGGRGYHAAVEEFCATRGQAVAGQSSVSNSASVAITAGTPEASSRPPSRVISAFMPQKRSRLLSTVPVQRLIRKSHFPYQLTDPIKQPERAARARLELIRTPPARSCRGPCRFRAARARA
jgi:hypothetical protein